MDGGKQLLVGFTAGAGVAAALYYLHQRKSATASTATSPKKKASGPRPKPPPPVCEPCSDDTPKTVEAFAAMGPRQSMMPYKYDLPSTTPPPGYVDIAITHCGICHSDVHQIDDAWKAACFPLIPGHEIVGEIVAIGGGVTKFAVGDRAAVGVQRGSCGACEQCESFMENVCPKITKTYAGPGKDKGGFASLIRYPADWTFSAPDGLASELVGPLMCAGITTYSPLKRFGVKGGKVGVIGIGGLGHIALQFAKHMGFSEVVAISRTPNKEEEAIEFGATSFLITENENDMKKAANTFDMILNTVSGHAPIDSYLALLKPRGTLACVGLPEKDQKSQLWFQSMVPTERNLVGSYLGPYDDYQEMLDFAREHNIKPKVEIMPAHEVNEAIMKVRNNSARYRVVLEFPFWHSNERLGAPVLR